MRKNISTKTQHNKWGLYQWFEEHGRDLIHSGSLDDFVNAKPSGKVFYCRDSKNGYLILEYGKESFSVKPSLFKEVSDPLFQIRQKVTTNTGNIVYIITDINWHFGKNDPFYYLSIDGKKKTKRYFSEDIRSTE